jgi:hypothetical protein
VYILEITVKVNKKQKKAKKTANGGENGVAKEMISQKRSYNSKYVTYSSLFPFTNNNELAANRTQQQQHQNVRHSKQRHPHQTLTLSSMH